MSVAVYEHSAKKGMMSLTLTHPTQQLYKSETFYTQAQVNLLIVHVRLPIGVKLLRKMGWKEGQGIGPRVKKKPKAPKPDSGQKVYGCALPPTAGEDSEVKLYLSFFFSKIVSKFLDSKM